GMLVSKPYQRKLLWIADPPLCLAGLRHKKGPIVWLMHFGRHWTLRSGDAPLCKRGRMASSRRADAIEKARSRPRVNLCLFQVSGSASSRSKTPCREFDSISKDCAQIYA